MKDYTTRDKYAEQSSAERRHCSAVATPTLRAAQTCSLYGLYAKHILVQIYSLYIQYKIVGLRIRENKNAKKTKILNPQKFSTAKIKVHMVCGMEN